MTTTAGRPRLAGFELMRGVAAFAVILMHAGLVVHNRCTPVAGRARDLGHFAVPFFLLTAFFFALRSEDLTALPWRDWLRRIARRLLVPFAVWSTFYFSLRLAVLWKEHRLGEMAAKMGQPEAFILSGGTSLVLYFIPLLIVGLLLCRVGEPLWQRAAAWQLALLLAGGILLQNGSRSLLPPDSLLAYAVRCLPLVAMAALLVRWTTHAPRRDVGALAGAIIFWVAVVLITIRWTNFPEVATAAMAWAVAWTLSGVLSLTPWIARVGEFSFGIFLVHQAVLEGMQMLCDHGLAPAAPLGLAAMLLLTAAVFAVSFLIVALAARGGIWCRLAFGLRAEGAKASP